MVPVLIGAAIAGAAAYKFFGDKERHDLALGATWSMLKRRCA